MFQNYIQTRLKILVDLSISLCLSRSRFESKHWNNFSAIVYIAVRIHIMFDYMNHNIGFFHGNYCYDSCLLFMLNITNLQRVKLDYFMLCL